MSSVVDVVLLAATYVGEDWVNDRLSLVNDYLIKHYNQVLVSVEDSKLPLGWYGGSKALQCDIAIGAYNGLDSEAFIAFLKTMPWNEDDGTTQVLIKNEHDCSFKLHDIHISAQDVRLTEPLLSED